MRRPLLVAGSASFLTMVFASLPGLNACVVFAAFFFLAAICFLFLRRRMAPADTLALGCMVCALSFAMFAVKTVTDVHPALALDEQSVNFTGRIAERPEPQNGRLRCEIQTSEIDFPGDGKRPGVPQKLRIFVTLPPDADAVAYGDTVSGQAALFAPSEQVRGRRYAKGLYLTGYMTEISEIKPAKNTGLHGLYGLAIRMRTGAAELISTYLPGEEGRLLTGLLIGSAEINVSTSEHYRVSGISHLLAVSGQQVAILGQLFMAIFAFFSVHKRVGAALTALPILFFMAVTGFSFSIVRAGIMYLIYLAGIVILRQSDPLTSLGAAVLLMLLLNPFSALDVGFQLSAAATLGIIVLTSRLHGFSRRLLRFAAGSRLADFMLLALSQTLSAILFTLPVTVAVFGSVSLIAPLGNLLAAVPVALILPLTVAGILAHLARLSFLASPVFLLCGLICRYMLAMPAALSKIPFALLSAESGTAVAVTAACMILTGAAVLLYGGKFPVRRIALLVLCIALCGAFSSRALSSGVVSIRVFDFEAGFCVMVSGGRQNVLIGAGGSVYEGSMARRALQSLRRPVAEALLLPEESRMYSGGAPLLAKSTNLLLSPETGGVSSRLKKMREGDVNALYAPCDLRLWKGTGAQILDGGRGSFIRFSIGKTVVLVSTPGADAACLQEAHRRADLWIAPPGLPANAALLDVRQCVVSGRGMPAQITASLLSLVGPEPVCTGGAGDLQVRTRGRGDLTIRRLRQ